MQKVIVYYTDSRLEEGLDRAVREQILKASGGIPIISVSQKPLDFGKNICVGLKPRCYLSLYQQLLTGLEAIEDGGIVYMCEHDVFYHPSHFEFKPPRKNEIFFNLNRYYFTQGYEHFVKAIGERALSQGVARKNVLLKHVRKQVSLRENNVPSPCIGPFNNFNSEFPNVDVRHGGNFSESWAFRNEGDKKDRIRETIDHWGTPRRFLERVNYEVVNTETANFLHMMFNLDVKENPVEVDIYRDRFPGLFKWFFFNKGAEVGVKRGLYSEVLCKEMPGVDLKCIDPYLPGPKIGWDVAEGYFGESQNRLKKYNVQHIKKTSKHAAAEDVPKWSLDFVYIDGDHRFNGVMQDIIIWSDRVRRGGIVSGHDYDIPDVKMAVDTYTEIHGHELFVTKSGRGYPDKSPSWFFAKP